MPSLPRVSIVTPVFNGERFIRRTIESVLGQRYPDIEYIIIDGGSSDGTLAIAREYAGRVSHLASGPDSGMYDALNKGFGMATGQVRCYLNADDIFFPDTVELVARRFAQGDTELCFGNCVYVDENERELFRYDGVKLPLWAIRWLGRIPFAQQTAFWRSDLHQRVGGFDSTYRYVGDTKFLLGCLDKAGTKVAKIDEYLALFRLHSEGFTAKASMQMTEEHHRVLRDLGIRPAPAGKFVDAYVKCRNIHNFARRCTG